MHQYGAFATINWFQILFSFRQGPYSCNQHCFIESRCCSCCLQCIWLHVAVKFSVTIKAKGHESYVVPKFLHLNPSFVSNQMEKKKKKKRLKEWESNWVFKDIWAIKLLQVEVVVGSNGKVNMVMC